MRRGAVETVVAEATGDAAGEGDVIGGVAADGVAVCVAAGEAGALPGATPLDCEKAVSEQRNITLRTNAKLFINDYFSALFCNANC